MDERTQTADSVPGPPPPPTGNWRDDLTPEEREREERKMAERKKKAEDSARRDRLENQWRERREAEQNKVQRSKDRENKQWEQQLAQARERAQREGVIWACSDDEKWWADLGKGLWKEVQDEFYCPHCDKHLNANTLAAHIQGQGHTKKLSWIPDQGPSAVAAPAAPTAPAAPAAPFVTSSAASSSAPGSRDYPEPPFQWQAWVPWVESEPAGERCLKCLLCDKWVQDDTSHGGTHQNPAGSKEHMKNLRNYGPGDHWYEEHVVQGKLKWHPRRPSSQPAGAAAAARPAAAPASASAASSSGAWGPRPSAVPVAPPAPPAATRPALPPGWSSAITEEGKTYYYHQADRVPTWDFPTASSPEEEDV